MESESLSMMTMNEMRTLMETLSAIYTDVCLLSADDVNDVHEGAYTASSEGKCYACGHKRHFSRHCAAKQALTTGEKACRIEVCGADVLHITVLPYKVEGRSYVLELVQRTPCQDTLDADSGERIMREISGYNTKLYRDALTGAYNRHYYEDVARKAPGPSCVAIMDLDDFKFCNDTYGHHAGDLALEAAANAIRACVRDNDVLIRFGGDEFLLILHGIRDDYLKIVLERVRGAVQNAVIPGFPHLHLSMSIGGVAQDDREPLEAAVRRADKLMYQAKVRKNTAELLGRMDADAHADALIAAYQAEEIDFIKPSLLLALGSAHKNEAARAFLASLPPLEAGEAKHQRAQRDALSKAQDSLSPRAFVPVPDAPMQKPRDLLLIDSGGQYLEGTTDITRTFALGPVTDEQKKHFTAVLCSMLNLANAKFLHGMTGIGLDILARGPIWDMGIDYRCGTGHGVSYLMSVHEGPNSFRWHKSPTRNEDTVQEPGMVTTDEPGVYIEGSHGIRTENELVCRKLEENEYGQFLGFEIITCAPIDLDAVIPDQMSPRQRGWLNDYHAFVQKTLLPLMADDGEREWLRHATRAI